MLPEIKLRDHQKKITKHRITVNDILKVLEFFLDNLQNDNHICLEIDNIRIKKDQNLTVQEVKKAKSFKESLEKLKELTFYLSTGFSFDNPQFIFDYPDLEEWAPDLPQEIREFLNKICHNKIKTRDAFIKNHNELIKDNFRTSDVKKSAKLKIGDYNIVNHLAEEDFADIYLAEKIKKDCTFEKACIKVIKDSKDNDLAENELRVLRSIQHKSIPVLVESFITPKGQVATVTKYIDATDLYELKEKYPKGVPQEHACWILERLLSVSGFMHKNDIIHGNIEPGSILVDDKIHNAYLINFIFSVIEPLNGGEFTGCTETYSAPEVYKKEQPDATADMYSLGKCMIYLLGGDIETNQLPDSVDSKLQRFLKEFVVSDPKKRKNDAWKAWHELKALRKEIFGKEHNFSLKFHKT